MIVAEAPGDCTADIAGCTGDDGNGLRHAGTFRGTSVSHQLAVVTVAVGHQLLFDAPKCDRRLRLNPVGNET
ncbi:hypothetical protein D3C87_1940050 [compost metagenome]